MTNRIQVAKVRKDFANVIGRSSRGERIKVTRYGTTLAAIVPKADLEKLEACEDEQPRSSPPTRAARRPAKSGSSRG